MPCDISRPAHHGEENALSRAALVRGDHVAKTGEVIGDALETEEALASGVGFVAAHHTRPLLGRHGARAGIGEQVDQDVAGFDPKQVVARLDQVPLAFGGCAVVERLDALDAERLDDGLHEAIINSSRLPYYFLMEKALSLIHQGLRCQRFFNAPHKNYCLVSVTA